MNNEFQKFCLNYATHILGIRTIVDNEKGPLITKN